MERTYNFPVFETQGGGLVREIKTNEGYKYIFVEAPPDCMGLGVGDFMPDMWGIIAANRQAREAIEEEQFPTSSLSAVMQFARRSK
jgi:hypothetical protein